jgi:hypothetical protein
LTSGPVVAGQFTVSTLTATSGPSGEDPSGDVRFTVFGSLNQAGPVTCLAVDGDTAIIRFDEELIFGFSMTLRVVDGQPDSVEVYFPGGGDPTDCSITGLTPSGFGGTVTSGDIAVVDAPPLPTSKEQCKNGGWRNYPGFRNQGDCVSFVATGGKSLPAGSKP